MTWQQNAARAGSALTTLLVIPALVIAIGHLAALYPDRSAFDWPSAGAFTILVFLYATFTRPGRASGVGAFIVGVLAAGSLWVAWLILTISLSSDWYDSKFSSFRVGLTGRGFGHAGGVFLLLWLASLLLMCGVALAGRRLVHTALADRR